jgi:DNA-binding MltR family transcriptional regulator
VSVIARARLLRAATGFAVVPPTTPELRLVHRWLDSWRGVGDVVVGMHRQGYDLQLTEYDERGWRATFYTTGMEHSATGGTASAFEDTRGARCSGRRRKRWRRAFYNGRKETTMADDEIPNFGPREQQIAESLIRESDRGAVMIGAAILDEDLEDVLRAYFRQDGRGPKISETLFSGVGPLSSFWAKVQFAYALRLIGNKTYVRLEWIRSIRNEFAHEYGPKSFDDPQIKSQLDEMIGAGPTRPGDEELLPMPLGSVKRGDFVRRLAFVLAVSRLGGRISQVKNVIAQGGNPRGFIEHMEKKHDW